MSVDLTHQQWKELSKEAGGVYAYLDLKLTAQQITRVTGAKSWHIPPGNFPWITFHFDDPAAETFFRLKYL